MKIITLKNVFLGLTLLATIPGMGWGQQCPDWSPKFDQMDDSPAVQKLQSERNQGWQTLNPEANGGMSYQQLIQQDEQYMQQYQQAIARDQNAWNLTSATRTPMPTLSWAQCQNMNAGASMAAACDADVNRNALLALEGTEDMLRCRAGMAPGSYSSSFGSGASSDPTGWGSGAGSSPWERGAASVSDLNVSKRSGMVNSVTRNWQPPAEQQALQDSLAQSTTLADPFADSEIKSTEVFNSASGDGPVGTNSTDVALAAGVNTSQETDSLADSAEQDRNALPTDASPAPSSQAEIASSIDPGIANSNDVSATPAAQVPKITVSDQYENPSMSAPSDTPSESQISASVDNPATYNSGNSSFSFAASSTIVPDASSSTDHSDKLFSLETTALGEFNDKFNENLVSKYVVNQGLTQAEAPYDSGAKLIGEGAATGIFNTDGSSGNYDAAVQKFNNDFNNLPLASVKAVLPGHEYIDALDSDVSSWQQTIQNAGATVKAKGQSIYNYLTGTTDCEQPGSLFKTECIQ